MVPGSTFRYGSNFCSETVRPRLSSRHPIDAAAMPLPSEETTPPVTKMNLATGHLGTNDGPRAPGVPVRGLSPPLAPASQDSVGVSARATLDRGTAGTDQLPYAFQI